jgi:hypothetical protein
MKLLRFAVSERAEVEVVHCVVFCLDMNEIFGVLVRIVDAAFTVFIYKIYNFMN